METEHQIERELTRGAARLPPKKSHTRFMAVLVVAGILLLLGVIYGVMKRQTHDQALAATADRIPSAVIRAGMVRFTPACRL